MKLYAAAAATLACILLIISATSCKKSDAGERIIGHVTYQKAPLTDAAVIFYPEAGRNSVGPLDSEGGYSISLAPGDYAVTVAISTGTPPGWKEGDPAPKPKIILPPEYTTRANSTLKASVKPGQSEPINFDLN
jgi:hypothetical protein